MTLRLMKKTEGYDVELLERLVQTCAVTMGMLLANNEREAVIWLASNFQDVIVTGLEHLGVDFDRTLKVKVHEN